MKRCVIIYFSFIILGLVALVVYVTCGYRASAPAAPAMSPVAPNDSTIYESDAPNEVDPGNVPDGDTSKVVIPNVNNISPELYVSIYPDAIDAQDETTASTSPQVLASRRMVVAHASLRVPAVEDSDSKENKEILQSMISKALSSPQAPVPTSLK